MTVAASLRRATPIKTAPTKTGNDMDLSNLAQDDFIAAPFIPAISRSLIDYGLVRPVVPDEVYLCLAT